MQGEAGKRYITPIVELLKKLKQTELINTAQFIWGYLDPSLNAPFPWEKELFY